MSLFSVLGSVDFQGDLVAGGNLGITASETVRGAGTSVAGADVSYSAQRGRLELAGGVTARKSLKLHAQSDLTTAAATKLQSGGDMDLRSNAGAMRLGAEMHAGNPASAAASVLLQSQHDLTVLGATTATDDVKIRSVRSNVSLYGDLKAVDRIEIFAGSTINIFGTLDAGGGVYLNGSASVTNPVTQAALSTPTVFVHDSANNDNSSITQLVQDLAITALQSGGSRKGSVSPLYEWRIDKDDWLDQLVEDLAEVGDQSTRSFASAHDELFANLTSR